MTRSRPTVIELPDGRILDMADRGQEGAKSVTVSLVGIVPQRFFDACPICRGVPTDDEHVPPSRLGGSVMTRTCGPCNNGLGSRVEADLADWFDGALTLPAFTAESVVGRRRTARILYRTTKANEFVFVVDGNADPAVAEMLTSGRVNVGALMPDEDRWRIALLKHAYLAACLVFGHLDGDVADTVRRDLLAARDARSRWEVPPSAVARGLTVLRLSLPGVIDAPVVRAVVTTNDGPVDGVVLGGAVFVSWSSRVVPNAAPVPPDRLTLDLHVGGRIEGTVTATEDCD